VDQQPSQPGVDFAAEYRAVHSTLWVLAAGLVHNRADADDVLQEAAIIAVRKLDDFRPGTSFRAWMAEIVRNVALNRRRQVRRQSARWGQQHDVHEAGLAAPQPAPPSAISSDGKLAPTQQHFDDRIMAALEQLDPVVRACVLLRIVENLSYQEISEVLSLPEGTCMSHVFRARKVLAAALAASESKYE
jgi:RNA polymerase sigma-70 factor (ECF subfamily)